MSPNFALIHGDKKCFFYTTRVWKWLQGIHQSFQEYVSKPCTYSWGYGVKSMETG